jgi:biotin transporter BioY
LCGAAFALIESLFYLSNPAGDGWAVLAGARAGTILLHITSTALVGWAMAAAWRDGNYWRLGLFYLLAVALHGLWNGMAVLSGLAAVLENPPANLRFLQLLARGAPDGIVLLGLLLFAILWGSNRYLHQREKEVVPTIETGTSTDPIEPYA